MELDSLADDVRWPPGFAYQPAFMSPLEVWQTLAGIEAERGTAARAWESVRFRGRTASRQSLSYGGEYQPTRRTVEAAPALPPWLVSLRDRALDAACAALGHELVLGSRSPEDFSQVIVWRYPVSSQIGWHCDAGVFGPTVLSISLLGPARLGLKHPLKGQCTLTLESGSLFVLTGEARWRWQHRVTSVRATRYSITIRTRA
jgi:alkylated DNA repair dioxygenase AlkB